MHPNLAMSAQDAMNYFGLRGDDAEHELERICVEHNIDVELAEDDGHIVWVNGTEIVEALFEEHKRNVGYRPDDPKYMARERAKVAKREEAERANRVEKRKTLVRRVAARKAAATRAKRG